MTKNLLGGLALASCLAGCRQHDPAPTRTQLLTGKHWYIASYLVTTPFSTNFDVYPLVPACQQDDFEEFVAPGTFIYDEGLTKCAPTDAQTQTGTWQLMTSDSQLMTSFNGNYRIYIVAELTNNSLRLKSSEINAKGELITYDISLVAR